MTMALWDREFIEGGLVHQSQQLLSCFITLSEPTTARSFTESGAALSQFIRGLNRLAGFKTSAGLPWCAVGELAPRTGRLHWHVLVAGVCYPWCPKGGPWFDILMRAKPDGTVTRPGEWITDPWMRSGVAMSKKSMVHPLAISNGFGAGFVGMRQVRMDVRDWSNVGSYMGKYLSKGDAGAQLPKGFQLVRASRAGSAWWPGHSLVTVRREHKERLSRSRAKSAEQIAEQPLRVVRDRTQLELVIP